MKSYHISQQNKEKRTPKSKKIVQKLLQIAQISPIWPLLSDEQKDMFLQNYGTLPSGKEYVSRRIQTERAPKRTTLMQLSDGRRIAV